MQFRKMEFKDGAWRLSGSKWFGTDYKKWFGTDYKKPPFKRETVLAAFDFAYDMSFGDKGEHRNHRSGGKKVRKAGEIFIDTFQGKLGEFAFCNLMYPIDSTVKPDLDMYGLGKWDITDFCINGANIAIKSTKFFGNLLLLETKDWDMNGNYIPNQANNHGFYDYFVLVRIKDDCAKLLKEKKWLYNDELEREELQNLIMSYQWDYDFGGFITHDDLVNIIRDEFIIRQGEHLGNNTIMDADNYYVQAIDMRDVMELRKLLSKRKG